MVSTVAMSLANRLVSQQPYVASKHALTMGYSTQTHPYISSFGLKNDIEKIVFVFSSISHSTSILQSPTDTPLGGIKQLTCLTFEVKTVDNLIIIEIKRILQVTVKA